jgi:hypothetical protein
MRKAGPHGTRVSNANGVDLVRLKSTPQADRSTALTTEANFTKA